MKMTRELFLLRMRTILDRDGSQDGPLLMRILEKNIQTTLVAHNVPFWAPAESELAARDTLSQTIGEMLRTHPTGYIEAVKYIRTANSMLLSESKHLLDSLISEMKECVCFQAVKEPPRVFARCPEHGNVKSFPPHARGEPNPWR